MKAAQIDLIERGPSVVRGPVAAERWSFPEGLLDHLLSAADAAPSLHNTQPWHIVPQHGGLALHVDRQRVLTAADPHGVAARISCGAALLNLRVAASLGYHCTVRLLPDPDDPTLLARVRIGGYRSAGADDHRLYQAIWRRRSHRGPFLDEPVSAAVLTAAADAARLEGASLDMLDEVAVRRLWQRCRATAHSENADPRRRAERDRWTRRADNTTDGMPRGPHLPPADAQPHVAALTLPTGRPVDQLRAGQALQRVLLQLTAHSAAASVLYAGSGPDDDATEPHDSRGHAVIHLRFGYPTTRPEATNRRATRDLTDSAIAASDRGPAAPQHAYSEPTGVRP